MLAAEAGKGLRTADPSKRAEKIPALTNGHLRMQYSFGGYGRE